MSKSFEEELENVGEPQQLKNAALVLDFYNGEEFANSKDTIVPIPSGVYDFVTEAEDVSVEDMWLELIDSDDLPELYNEIIEAVIDFDEKTWNTTFNGGTLQIAYGDNILYIHIQPDEVHGVEVFKTPPHTHSFGLIKDMGVYNIAVRFYILDDEAEVGEADAFESLDEDESEED